MYKELLKISKKTMHLKGEDFDRSISSKIYEWKMTT